MRKSLIAIAVGGALFLAGCSVQPIQVLSSTIQAIQGSGATSPMVNVAQKRYESDAFYAVSGVVTAVQTQALGRDLPVGFFLQAPSDNNAATSDGIFVETNEPVKVGDLVHLTGQVKEDYLWTKLVNVKNLTVLKQHQPLPAPVVLNIDSPSFAKSLERYEGMRVKITKNSDLHVTKNFGYDYGPRRNNLALSHKNALIHPNQHSAPSVQKSMNDENVLVVESFKAPPRGEILWYPSFGQANGKGGTDHYIRINDLVDGLEGVLGYSYGKYRLYVTNQADKNTFIHIQDRQAEPPLGPHKNGNNLRIASFNVLNYFNTSVQGSRNPLGQNRGAHDKKAFALQSEKIATAIAKTHADIVGLMEIENNGFGEHSAVADLVKKVNHKIKNPTDHYTFVKPTDGQKYIGGDAITSQVLYKPSKVHLASYRVIKMPMQDAPGQDYTDGKRNNYFRGQVYQRDTLAPTFVINGTNKALTVAVNHFKSKGSPCWEDVKTGKKLDADHQGSCENLRVAAAETLGSQLENIKGSKVIIGDLNSYGNEDPVMVLTNRANAPKGYKITAANYTKIDGTSYAYAGKNIDKSFGYVNIVRQLHPNAYSYAYGNHIGTLDYILISKDLVPSVLGATDWNINAGESTLFEYSDRYNCDYNGRCSPRYKDIYRASDHDPAVLDLNINKLKN